MHSWNLVIIPGIMRTSGARQATQIGVRRRAPLGFSWHGPMSQKWIKMSRFGIDCGALLVGS